MNTIEKTTMGKPNLKNMKRCIVILLVLVVTQSAFAQERQIPKFYLGLSYGTSFAIGDFEDVDIRNPDAGFAKDGRKVDVFGGFFLNENTTLIGTFRYQSFETEIGDIIEMFNAENPGANFTGSTEDWQTYFFLVGLAYRISVGSRLNFGPIVGLGPLLATNPGITVNAPDAAITNNFERSSETGIGVGYEVGIAFKTDLGKRLSLLPTFTFSGGFVTINDVTTITDNVIVTRDYQPIIQSFNLGLSLGYRFY